MSQSTSVDLILGARDNQSSVVKRAEKSQEEYRKSLGDTADTSARTTAALALMLQSMEDSPIKGFITDLSILKGTMDSVRAAQMDNASSIERMVANLSLYFAIFNVGSRAIEFWRQSTSEVKRLKKEISEMQELTSRRLAASQESRAFGIDIEKEKEAIRVLEVQQRLVRDHIGRIEQQKSRNFGFNFGNVEELELLNEKQKMNMELLRDHRAAISAYNIELKRKNILEAEAVQESFRQRDRDNKAVVEGLQDQVLALKMTADELTMYKLRLNGVHKAEEERAEALIKEKNALIEKKKAQEEATRALEEAAKAQQKAVEKAAKDKELAQQREFNRLEAEKKRIIEANLTPLERFRKDYQRLADVKFKLGLDSDVMKKELEKLKKNLRDDAGLNAQFRTPGPLQAESSRFLARVRGDNTPAHQTAQNTKETKDLLKKAEAIFNGINGHMATVAKNTAKKNPVYRGT